MRNEEFYKLYMDAEGLRRANIFVSDIDFNHECDDGYIVLIECKYKGYWLKGRQARLLTDMADRLGGAVLEVWHDKRVQDGAKSVDVAVSPVHRAYTKGEWYSCGTKPPTLREFLVYLDNKHAYTPIPSLKSRGKQ